MQLFYICGKDICKLDLCSSREMAVFEQLTKSILETSAFVQNGAVNSRCIFTNVNISHFSLLKSEIALFLSILELQIDLKPVADYPLEICVLGGLCSYVHVLQINVM